jgi:hypothetical protein
LPARGVAAIILGMHMPRRDAPAEEKQDESQFRGIRCPLCRWQPKPWSRWCCCAHNTPEPLFDGCLTEWNTFTTKGRCPGCGHQWRWTLCLNCDGWSTHDDWYEKGSA